MATFLVSAVIFGIVAFSGYRTYKSHRKGGGCSCGCSGCSKSANYSKH
ncbi:FeoB-associated Cys-rich membrane protein [Clostridium sp. JNZ X4-2]